MQAEQSIVVDPKSPGGINSLHGLIVFDRDASYTSVQVIRCSSAFI